MATTNEVKVKSQTMAAPNNSGNAVPVQTTTDANGNPTVRTTGVKVGENSYATPVTYTTDANGNPTAKAVASNGTAGITSPAEVAGTSAASSGSSSSLPTWSGGGYSVGAPGYTPTEWKRQAIFEDGGLDKYNAESEARINALYEKGLEKDLAALESAYDQNKTTLQREQDQIGQTYQTARNQMAGQGEQAKRNMNMQAAASGINSGAGSQMQLANNVAMQQAQASLTADENRMITESIQRLTDLQVKYQNDVAQAIANNDYQLAAALLDEYKEQFNRASTVESYNMQIAFHQDSMKAQYAQMALQAGIANAQMALESEKMKYDSEWKAVQWENTLKQQDIENQRWDKQWEAQERDYWQNWKDNEYNKQLQEAQLKASMGDFSGYSALGWDIDNDYAKTLYNAQNPQYAYLSGAITEDQYYKLTGSYPPQYYMGGGSSGGGGGYGGYGGGGGYPTNNTTTYTSGDPLQETLIKMSNSGSTYKDMYNEAYNQLNKNGTKTKSSSEMTEKEKKDAAKVFASVYAYGMNL